MSDGAPNAAPLLSVVICTYNRAELLAGAIETLAAQTAAPRDFEVVVVDNNSGDDTKAVAAAFTIRHSNIAYVFEPRQGLSHARNRGIAAARGAYVAYLDDECRAPANWVSCALEIIHERAPAAFGGPYVPWYDGPKPAWWRDEYETFTLGKSARVLEGGEYLSGGNVAFRKALLDALGGFDPRYGMKGKALGYGEETVLIRRLRAEHPGEAIYYDPRMQVAHLVSRHKMRLAWQFRRSFVHGRYVHHVFGAAEASAHKPALALRCICLAAILAFHMMRPFAFRDRVAYPRAGNYLFERGSASLVRLGRLYEQMVAEW